MLGTQYAYLYDQEETHCCISSKPDYDCSVVGPHEPEIMSVRGGLQRATPLEEEHGMIVDGSLPPAIPWR